MLDFLSPHIPDSELIDRSSVWFRLLRVMMLPGAMGSTCGHLYCVVKMGEQLQVSSVLRASGMVCVVQGRRKVNRGGNNISHSDFIWRIF